MFEEEEIDIALALATAKIGYERLRPLQELAVKKFAQGNDVFVNLPTGSGKSACFCIIPPLFDALRNEPGSIAIVVCPLVALMKDQVEAMKKRGISAVYVGDSSGHDITTKICSGTFQLVYLSPESLLTNDTWRDMLQTPTYQQHLAALVIDEAHCVKQW